MIRIKVVIGIVIMIIIITASIVQAQIPGVPDSVVFYDIDFLDENHGVAVGYNHWHDSDDPPTGTVVFYENGEWKRDESFPLVYYDVCPFLPQAVAYLSLEKVLVVHEVGGIIRRENGQWLLNEIWWNRDEQGFPRSLYDIGKLGSRIIVVGSRSRICESLDQGKTWTLIPADRNPAIETIRPMWTRVCVLDSNYAWVCGSDWTIMATKDGGQTWQIQYADTVSTGLFDVLRSIDFCDSLNGWAVGDQNRIYKTADGGKTWERVEVSFYSYWPDPVHVFNKDKIWIWVPEIWGAWETLDGGNTWHIILSDIDWVWYFVSDNEMWVAGFENITFYQLAVKEIPNTPLPTEFTLFQNYPNPFNTETTIRFAVASREHVHLAIYNLLGQEIEVLVDKELVPGTYSVTWDASQFPSGIYFYCLQADKLVKTKKMTLIK